MRTRLFLLAVLAGLAIIADRYPISNSLVGLCYFGFVILTLSVLFNRGEK